MANRIHLSGTEKKKDDVTFEVVEEVGIIADRGKGGQVRIDYAAWNGNQPKYEIRIWKDKDGQSSPTKGIGLTGEELIALGKLINQLQKGGK